MTRDAGISVTVNELPLSALTSIYTCHPKREMAALGLAPDPRFESLDFNGVRHICTH